MGWLCSESFDEINPLNLIQWQFSEKSNEQYNDLDLDPMNNYSPSKPMNNLMMNKCLK